MARTRPLMIQIATGDPRPIGKQIVEQGQRRRPSGEGLPLSTEGRTRLDQLVESADHGERDRDRGRPDLPPDAAIVELDERRDRPLQQPHDVQRSRP